MKKIILIIGSSLLAITSFAQDKLITKTGDVKFYSHTEAEDITSHNYKVISSLEKSTGKFVFSVPMQSFELEPALRQKHFNSAKFLDTKQFPKAKFKGNITDLSAVDFTKDGVYNVSVAGSLTIHGVTKKVTEKGVVTVKGGKTSAKAMFSIALGDYGVFFTKGKPSKNIAKTVEITVDVKY